MGLAVGAAAGFDIRQIVAAVANDPAGVVAARLKVGDGDEGGKHWDRGLRIEREPWRT
jgi:hypothetical protein